MARVFTIQFDYENESYTSLVMVKTTPYYLEFTLNNLDFHLLLQLPGNKIISPSPKNYFFPHSTNENSPLLMETIIKAVSAHLQAVS